MERSSEIYCQTIKKARYHKYMHMSMFLSVMKVVRKYMFTFFLLCKNIVLFYKIFDYKSKCEIDLNCIEQV